MNEAAREAERRWPGVCHHEAAHAVFSYRANQPIAYVTVESVAPGEGPESVARVRYSMGDPVSIGITVAGILSGKYAQERAATGERKRHVPYEEFDQGFMDAIRTYTPPAGIGEDELQASIALFSLGRDNAQKVYDSACAVAAELVERWWDEIDAVANRLLEVGRIDGAEVGRIIEGARKNDERT
ncbi:MAG: hypothetical protein ACRDTR_05885 [Rubrobacter sp.]